MNTSSKYYVAGLRYCQDMEQQVLMPTLFDYLETVKAEQTNG
jgi:hypothetical protein